MVSIPTAISDRKIPYITARSRKRPTNAGLATPNRKLNGRITYPVTSTIGASASNSQK
jgi:hypothetical protein